MDDHFRYRVRFVLQVNGSQELSFATHEVGERGVKYVIAIGRGLVDAISSGTVGRGEFSDLVGRACQTDETRVEGGEKLLKPRRSVSHRVGRNEDRRNRYTPMIETVDHGADHLRIEGALVGTVRIAEINQHRCAAEIPIRDRSARLVEEREGA